MAPKPYPACLCVHPQVQAVLELRQQGVVTADAADEIEDIRCDVPAFYVDLVYEPASSKAAVGTPYEARFSAPYCIARALVDGRLDVDSFTPEKLRDAKVLAITKKVSYRVEPLPEFPAAFPARVTLTKVDGSKHRAYVAHNLGSGRNPLTEEQIAAKFQACAERALGRQHAEALESAIRHLAEPGGEIRFRSALRAAHTGS